MVITWCRPALPAGDRIECFYSNVHGPVGSSSLLNHTSPNFGIPLVELQAAWDKPFKPESEGGCPGMPHLV